jgi:signal transduction histidine kinase
MGRASMWRRRAGSSRSASSRARRLPRSSREALRARARILLLVAGAIVGIAAEWAAYGWNRPGRWLPDLITGWALIACGLAGSAARPGSRSGPLLAATGFAWFAGNFSAAANYLHRGPLVHLVLSYPGATLAPRRARVALVAGYAAAVVPAVWRSEVVTIALSAAVIAVAAAVHTRAVGRERRASGYALRASAFLAVVLAGTAAIRLALPTQVVTDATLLAYEAALCLLAAALVAGLARSPWERTPVADLVLELGERRSGTLRDSLARALGDPALEVGYWLGNGYVDAEGRPLMLPAMESHRSVTPVERDGEPIAVLVHDPAVLDDPGLSDALATAARLAASNARLQAELRAQLAELSASRRRLVHAGDEERRRLERRLRETVERRLIALARVLEDAQAGAGSDALERAEERLARVRDELGALAAGLHPGGLDKGGLPRALESLVARSPVPVELSVSAERLPEEIATAAYFVCSEAFANAIKYAHASRVGISVHVDAGRVRVVVGDDGVGGADPAAGTGLRGLADRLEALGGTFAVESRPGVGTRLTAELPLNGDAN